MPADAPRPCRDLGFSHPGIPQEGGWGFVTAAVSSRASPAPGGDVVLRCLPSPHPPPTPGGKGCHENASCASRAGVKLSFTFLIWTPQSPMGTGGCHIPSRVRALSVPLLPQAAAVFCPQKGNVLPHSCSSSFFGTAELLYFFFWPIPGPWQSGDFNSEIANCKLGEGKKKKPNQETHNKRNAQVRT